MRPLLFFLLSLFISTTFSSCGETERDQDLETLTAREVALSYHVFDDALREVHRFAMRDSLLNDTGIVQRFNSCIEDAYVSDTVAVFPLYLTINYGGDTNICDDGFNRFGVIRAAFSGKYLNKSTVVTVTFDEYYKDQFRIDGTVILTNLGLNSDGYMMFDWEVIDGHITGINTNITWEGEHEKTWVAGRSFESQSNVDDDIFHIEGISKGRNSRGNTFENEITNPYVADYSCQWFTAGTSSLDIPNLEARRLNFGLTTECDNLLIERRNNTYLEVEIPY